MKKLTLILAASVLFAGVSFAQQNPDPAKNPRPNTNQNSKSDKNPATNKKVPAKTGSVKSDKKAASTPATK